MNNEFPNFDEQQYEELLSSLSTGTYVFLGAGISKLAGYMLWDELAKKMNLTFWDERKKNEKLKINMKYSKFNCLNRNKPIDVMDYLHSLDSDLFYEILNKELGKKAERPEIYLKFSEIYSVVNNRLIQTNADQGFQKSQNIPEARIAINPNFSSDSSFAFSSAFSSDFNIEKKLYYLHGRVNKQESLVFTRMQYDAAYLKKDSKIIGFLLPIFKTTNVVFFGYSFQDYEITQAISMARLDNSNPKVHYIFTPHCEIDSTQIEVEKRNLWTNFGVKLITYPIEEDGYEALFKLLDSLNAKLQKIGKSQDFSVKKNDKYAT